LFGRLKSHTYYSRTLQVWPYTAAGAWLAIKNTATKLSIRLGPDGRSTIHPHSFRHAYGYRMINMDLGAKTSAAQIRLVQESMGHKDPRSTLVYTQPTKNDVEKARRKMLEGN
jgi:integrase